MQVGEKIKNLRLKLGLSQEELAVKSGISRVTISKLENGSQNITTNKTLAMLGEALGCKASYFLQ